MVSREAVKAVFERALKLKEKESCLVVADTIKEGIGRSFYEFAREITPDAKMVVMEPTLEHASEPPSEIAELMMKYDVELLITSKSLTHTRAREKATKRGARIATMPGITEDIANRCLDIDYDALKLRSTCVYDLFIKSSVILITTELGTNVEFAVGKSGFFGKDGGVFDYPGAFGNLPEGEVSFSPERCSGKYVVDASFPGLGLLTSPITFEVESGVVRRITGARAAEVIKRLDRVGPRAYKVAELGIGLNPKAKIIGKILEDEKVIGTVHVAVGNDISYGGHNDVPLHLDGVITAPNIRVDGKEIMKNGKFLEFSSGI